MSNTNNEQNWYSSELFQSICKITENYEISYQMMSNLENKPKIYGPDDSFNSMVDFLSLHTADLTINDNKSGIFRDNFDGKTTFGDEVTDYTVGVNSLNFRSPEFTNNPEIIFSGCSVSYGVGVPADGTWIEALKNYLNPSSYVALAKPAASSQKIVFTIFKYIFKYGKPKKIFVLFPDPYRTSSVSDFKNLTESPDRGGVGTYPVDLLLTRDKKTLAKYSKRPHILKEIFIPEIGFKSTIEAIHSLEAFCKAAEIDLMWSTWDIDMATIATFLNKDKDNKMFPSFSLLAYEEFRYGSSYPHVEDGSCKPEVYKKYKKHYTRGTDRQKYYGAHSHAHIADGFIKEIEKRRPKN